jgi:hypothetical protein
MTKEIDYYGEADNYIHLKWGDVRKMYNFTDDFMAEYAVFSKEYRKYWDSDNTCVFKNSYMIIKYIKDYNIPVHLYFNMTDTPATTEESLLWWLDNNVINKLD